MPQTPEEEKANLRVQAHMAGFLQKYRKGDYNKGSEFGDHTPARRVYHGSTLHQWQTLETFIRDTDFDQSPVLQSEEIEDDQRDILESLENVTLSGPAIGADSSEIVQPFTVDDQEEAFKNIKDRVFPKSLTSSSIGTTIDEQRTKKDQAIRDRKLSEIHRRNVRRTVEMHQAEEMYRDTVLTRDDVRDIKEKAKQTEETMIDEDGSISNTVDSSKSKVNDDDDSMQSLPPLPDDNSLDTKEVSDDRQDVSDEFVVKDCPTVDTMFCISDSTRQRNTFQYYRQREVRRFRDVTNTLYNFGHDYDYEKSGLLILAFSEKYFIGSNGEYMHFAEVTSADPVNKPEFRATPVPIPTGLATIRVVGDEAIVSIGTGELFIVDLTAGSEMYIKRTRICEATNPTFGQIKKPNKAGNVEEKLEKDEVH
jgi:hypothetical protein